MSKVICNECETVAHCMKNGCVPKQQALNKMADNARELRLDYEQQAQQEPCDGCYGSGWITCDPDIGTDQECFVCNGKGTVEPERPAQRTWVGLTEEEIQELRLNFATRSAIYAIEAKLKEKNT